MHSSLAMQGSGLSAYLSASLFCFCFLLSMLLSPVFYLVLLLDWTDCIERCLPLPDLIRQPFHPLLCSLELVQESATQHIFVAFSVNSKSQFINPLHLGPPYNKPDRTFWPVSTQQGIQWSHVRSPWRQADKADGQWQTTQLSFTQSLPPVNRNKCFLEGLTEGSLSIRRHAHGLLAKRLMHMAHKIGNTSGVSKSSSDWLNDTGFPWDVCDAKDAVTPNPSWKKKAIVFTTVMMSTYQDQINAGFSKVCEIFKVCGTESLKYVR